MSGSEAGPGIQAEEITCTRSGTSVDLRYSAKQSKQEVMFPVLTKFPLTLTTILAITLAKTLTISIVTFKTSDSIY